MFYSLLPKLRVRITFQNIVNVPILTIGKKYCSKSIDCDEISAFESQTWTLIIQKEEVLLLWFFHGIQFFRGWVKKFFHEKWIKGGDN